MQPPLALLWWYEHLICQDGLEPEVIQYLGDHLLEEIAKAGAAAPRMPAPVLTRVYLRTMQPALATPGELITAESDDLLPTLGYVLAMHAPFGGEFHAGVDAARVKPPLSLLIAAAAARLARRVAAAVAEDRRAPGADEVAEELATVLQVANLEGIREEPALQAKCGARARARAGEGGAKRGGARGAGRGARGAGHGGSFPRQGRRSRLHGRGPSSASQPQAL
jgi:hypothetical protein